MQRGRLIAVGDIHGCHEEFQELLQRVSPVRGDVLVLLGDLVNRGPASSEVLALARQVGAICLLGNHERRLKRFRQSGRASLLKAGDRATLAQLTRADWSQIEAMPLLHHELAADVVCVHGGFLPGRPWWGQSEDIVTRIQVVDSLGRARKRTEAPGGTPWHQLWKGPPFVVYGHTPAANVVRRTWSLCLDTGCATGGRLSAWIHPDDRIVQVPARATYWT